MTTQLSMGQLVGSVFEKKVSQSVKDGVGKMLSVGCSNLKSNVVEATLATSERTVVHGFYPSVTVNDTTSENT